MHYLRFISENIYQDYVQSTEKIHLTDINKGAVINRAPFEANFPFFLLEYVRCMGGDD